LLALVFVVGMLLRSAPWAFNRSLWVDEARLALNILGRPAGALLQPLDDRQGAPVGFLLLEKLAVQLFGEGERALRLVPLVAGIASMGLFYALARRWLSSAEALFALALFALCPPLVYYSSEVKQYSTDVLVALALLWAGERSAERTARTRDWLALVLAGAAGVWISHPAAFVCAGVGLALGLRAWRQGEIRDAYRYAAVSATWAASFLVSYWLVLRRADPGGYLLQFWADGFPPVPPRSLADLLWPARTFIAFFNDPAGLRFAGLAAAAFTMGVLRWLAAAPRIVALLVMPAVFTLLASLLGRYPFPTSVAHGSFPVQGRLILFLVPPALILIAAGVGWLFRPGRPVPVRALGAVAAIALLVPPALDAAGRFPRGFRIHDVRPLVEEIGRPGQDGDVVVINARARPLWRYYARRLEASRPLLAGFDPVELGGTNRWAVYDAQLRALPKGARVWLLYAHHPTWRTDKDEAFVVHVLDALGEQGEVKRAPGASLRLYRLGG